MKINVVMPKMGESVNEGTIIKWHKKKGEKVKKDEIIFEISTDKVDTEIPSPADGVLSEIKVFEQETVSVDTVVAVIDTNGTSSSSEEKEIEKAVAPEPVVHSTKQVGGNIVDIPMPKMGESVMEGTIIKWHKKPGDFVKKDEVLFEISTDKVDTEVPSPEEGTLSEILVGEQQTVEVGTIVAKISSRGGIAGKAEKIEEPVIREENLKPPVRPDIADSQLNTSYNEPVGTPTAGNEDSFSGKREGSGFYSPLVMNIARKENISQQELESISGSGVEGRVTKKDVLAYLEKRLRGEEKTPAVKQREGVQTVPAGQTSSFEQPEYRPSPEFAERQTAGASTFGNNQNQELIPMDNIRQKIMQHMVNSRDTSVHVAGIIEVDMTKISNFIKNNKEDFLKRENIKLTFMPFIAYACIKALKEYPYVNSSISGTNIVVKKYINLGFAVAVEPNGLIVPNIKNADEKNIRGLAKAISELSNKSRNKKLLPDDISAGTFTITNYGVFGTLFGNPIINQPEVAILGVGAIEKKPVVLEVDGTDTIAVRSMMYLSLSHDHRLIDGMLGGKFLKSIKDTLENFDTSII